MPIVPSSKPLSAWQRKQAAMLSHFASLEYLKNLHRMVSEAIDGFIEPLLSLAKQQRRDSILINPRWACVTRQRIGLITRCRSYGNFDLRWRRTSQDVRLNDT